MPPVDRARIEKALAKDLNLAQEAFRLATVKANDITSQVPSGIPAPDSNLRINQAGADRARCYSALNVALQRWSDFVRNGVVPEDLKK